MMAIVRARELRLDLEREDDEGIPSDGTKPPSGSGPFVDGELIKGGTKDFTITAPSCGDIKKATAKIRKHLLPGYEAFMKSPKTQYIKKIKNTYLSNYIFFIYSPALVPLK